MERVFYDLNVSFYNENLLERIKYLGLGGICIVASQTEDIDGYLEKIKMLRENTNVDIITGILIEEKADKVLGLAKSLRRKMELILVSGGDYETNRIACSSNYVDILCHPEKGRRDVGVDHICCREAREHNTIIELNFRELITATGMDKIRELNKMKEIVRLCNKTNAKFIVNSGAKNVFELRSGRDLSSLSFCSGASLQDALLANSDIPEKLVSMNREKLKQPLDSVYFMGENHGR
jgi:RNase P/RNase MRP subunit p30